MKKRRKTRRTQLDKALAAPMRQARAERLAFEKKLSEIVSQAIGLEATVKLKKPTKGSPAEKCARKAGGAADYYKRLDLLASPSAPLESSSKGGFIDELIG